MDSLLNKISLFDNTLRKYNLNNYIKLYEPLNENQILQKLTKIEINYAKIFALFSWKNGYDPDLNINITCDIFDFGCTLSLDAISQLVIINKNNPLWSTHFIPLITDTTGQYILFNNQKGTDFGKLYLYSPSLLFGEFPVSYYDSIYTMIETTIRAYTEGAFIYDPKRRLVGQRRVSIS